MVRAFLWLAAVLLFKGDMSSQSTDNAERTEPRGLGHRAERTALRHQCPRGAGYFNIDDNGEVQVSVDFDGKPVTVSLMEIVRVCTNAACTCRPYCVSATADHRIEILNKSFAKAIADGALPQIVPRGLSDQGKPAVPRVEEIADYGRQYSHGFEAGSKAELIIAMAQLRDSTGSLSAMATRTQSSLNWVSTPGRWAFPAFCSGNPVRAAHHHRTQPRSISSR